MREDNLLGRGVSYDGPAMLTGSKEKGGVNKPCGDTKRRECEKGKGHKEARSIFHMQRVKRM